MIFLGVPPGYYDMLYLMMVSIPIVIILLISCYLYYKKNRRIAKGKTASRVFFGLLGIFVISLPIGFISMGIINTVIIVEIIVNIMGFFIFIYLIESKKKILKKAGVDYSRPKTIIPKENDWKSIAGRAGPLITLIVGSFFVIDGVFGIFSLGFYTLICGIIAILAIYFGYKGVNNARFICLVPGILAVVGLFLRPPWGFSLRIFWSLGYSQLLFLDYIFIFLILLGGVLSIVSEERFLNYYIDKRDIERGILKVEEEMDNIEDLEQFLKTKLSTDWEKIKLSFNAYKAGELPKRVFIEVSIKNIGKDKFTSLFLKSPNQE